MCASLLQLCLTLYDPKDCSPPGSSLHGILQVRILEWVAMPSTRGSSPPRDRTGISFVSWIAGGFFTSWATREAPSKWSVIPQTFHHCPLLPCFLLHIPHIPISYFYFPTSTVLFLYNLLPGTSHSISFASWNLPESITHYLLHGLPYFPQVDVILTSFKCPEYCSRLARSCPYSISLIVAPQGRTTISHFCVPHSALCKGAWHTQSHSQLGRDGS